jgi:thiosulfate dehydrogenase [quinone] large subunit
MTTPSASSEKTLAFLLLRLWLAQRSIVTGLEKFAGQTTVKRPVLDEFGNPDISGAVLEVKVKSYALGSYHGMPESLMNSFRNEPLLPGFLLNIYAGSLGFLLISTGLLLLLGVCTRTMLFLTGLIYISLTLGLILINQNDGVAWLGIHVLLTAFALTLASHNKFALVKKF